MYVCVYVRIYECTLEGMGSWVRVYVCVCVGICGRDRRTFTDRHVDIKADPQALTGSYLAQKDTQTDRKTRRLTFSQTDKQTDESCILVLVVVCACRDDPREPLR